MQNLSKYLRDFNSKERSFLVGQILGNPGFTLSSEFREKLRELLEIPIPADALSAMDYHIDWLYASLRLAKDGDPSKVYPNDDYKIKAHQEDVAWLIAFKSENIYHLVLIEAKGVTSWTNKQMTSKANRFGDIFVEQGTTWPGVSRSSRLPAQIAVQSCNWLPLLYFESLEKREIELNFQPLTEIYGRNTFKSFT